MSTKNYVSINSLTTEDRSKLKSAISEINDSMVRAASEKDVQKEFVDKVSEDLGIDKKLVKRLAKAYYKSNFNNEVQDFEKFEEFYMSLFQGGGVQP
jgi:ABC-type microcin C transport system permease subunit YejB